jgi:3-dehydroquinate dehydratase
MLKLFECKNHILAYFHLDVLIPDAITKLYTLYIDIALTGVQIRAELRFRKLVEIDK